MPPRGHGGDLHEVAEAPRPPQGEGGISTSAGSQGHRNPANLRPCEVATAPCGADVGTDVGRQAKRQISPVPPNMVRNFKLWLKRKHSIGSNEKSKHFYALWKNDFH